MAYHQDWFMRQIRQFIEAVARVLLGKDLRAEQPASSQWKELEELLNRRGACKAEDFLLDRFDPADRSWLEAGLALYSRLNDLTDQELEEQNFSREEIREGIRNLCSMAGAPDMELLFGESS